MSLRNRQVTREPVKTRAVDAVVQKTVMQTSEDEKVELTEGLVVHELITKSTNCERRTRTKSEKPSWN